MPVIEFNHLTKNYGKGRGILDVTFAVEEGEVFGFIGPNGAGKSTAIRTLLNLIYPTTGSATIFGMDIVNDTKEIRKRIGYLPAEINYYEDMRVKDLLKFSCDFYNGNYEQRIQELSNRLQLDLEKRIEDLSFGNRKKVGIVQALAHNPKLLILDEPTSGLDPLMQKVFFEILEDEKDNGTTIFFSSHILTEVQRLCDRIAIIKEGRIMKVGPIQELIEDKFKKVKINFSGEVSKLNFPGIIGQEQEGNALKLLYRGSMKRIIDAIQPLDIEDLVIEDPSLDEMFMHYYEVEDEQL